MEIFALLLQTLTAVGAGMMIVHPMSDNDKSFGVFLILISLIVGFVGHQL